jgi:hypothetical protein
VSPVRYELGFYIAKDGILHSHRCENLKSYKYTYNSKLLDKFLSFLRLKTESIFIPIKEPQN